MVLLGEPAVEADKVRVIVENKTLTEGAAWTGTLVDEWVEIGENTNALQAVKSALEAKNYTYVETSGYISEINGLSDQATSMGGWMFTKNDYFPDTGLGDTALAANDVFCLQYTCAYGADIGYDWQGTDTSLKTLEVSGGKLANAFASETKEYDLVILGDSASVAITATAVNKKFPVTIADASGNTVHAGANFTANVGDKITVTCGIDTVYTLTVTSQSTTALLKGLIVHGQFNPSKGTTYVQNPSDSYDASVLFDAQTMEYTLDTIATDTSNQLRFRAQPYDASATVTLKWENAGGTGEKANMQWTGGMSTWANCLSAGENTLKLVVANGDTTETYVLHVNVKPTLTALSVNNGSLTFNNTFSAANTEYELNVPAGATELTFEATPRNASYAVAYDGAESNVVSIEGKDEVEVTVAYGNVTNTYTVAIKRIETASVNFTILPEEAADATVTVSNEKLGALTADENGSYTGMFSAYTFTYTVAKYGYVTQQGVIPAEGGNISVTLSRNSTDAYEDTGSDWNNFRNSDTNMGITDAKTPVDPDATALLWNKKLGSGWAAAPSVQIIVDNALIVMSGKKIYKLDLETGDILAEGDMVNSPSYGYTPPTYAEGLIFCPLGGGTIQAFNAKTLESVWVYKDPQGGQSLSPITYSDGYVYTGFWNSETKSANYVCLSVANDHTAEGDDSTEKLSTWTWNQMGGFYWAGSVAVGNYLIVGTDDGTSGTAGDSTLYAFNKQTGKVVSKITLTGLGDQRSSIAWDASSGRVYFTTKGGYLCSAKFDSESGTLSDLKSVQNVEGAQTTSTPVVYDGVVYYGVGAGFSANDKNSFVSANAETLELNYTVGLKGYPQCSVLLSTAYEDEGYLYFYATYNTTPGGISMIKVKKGATSASDTELVEIYDAAGFSQYCISSIICGKDGTLYYKNDSGNILAVGTPKYGNVIRLIKQIGTVDESSAEAIIKAREAYDMLDDDNKAKVSNYSTLTDAEDAIVKLTESKIDAIGEVTLENADKVESAAKLYDSLSESLQNRVTNADELAEARKALSDLKVAEAERLIAEIPAVINKNNKDEATEKVAAAQDYLNTLTEEELQKVAGKEKIDEALKTLKKLNAPAGGSTHAVGVGVLVGYKVSDATNKVNEAIEKALSDLPEDLNEMTEEQENNLLEAGKLYEALTEDEKLFVTEKEAFEAILNAYGDINHQDAATGMTVSNLPWYIRLLAIEQEIDSEAAEAMHDFFLEKGAISKHYYVTLINLLTGETYQPAEWVMLNLPTEKPEDGSIYLAYAIDIEGDLTLIQGVATVDEIADATEADEAVAELTNAESEAAEVAEETAVEENPDAIYRYGIQFNTTLVNCWYGVILYEGSWSDLIEGDALSEEMPENWSGWMTVPEDLPTVSK